MAIVIVGGTRGIGFELAKGIRPADEPGFDGTLVLGYSSDEEAATRACEELSARGFRVVLAKADISSEAGAAVLLSQVPEDLQVDCLIHAAVRVAPGALVDDAADGAWEGALAVNAMSLLWLVRAARRRLTRGSSVLYLTSRGSTAVIDGYGSVGPAKSLGEALVRYLAVELAPAGVRVNALGVAAQDTHALRQVFGERTDEVLAGSARKNPSRRAVAADDYVPLARFLTSSEAGMITGHVHGVYGGADLR